MNLRQTGSRVVLYVGALASIASGMAGVYAKDASIPTRQQTVVDTLNDAFKQYNVDNVFSVETNFDVPGGRSYGKPAGKGDVVVRKRKTGEVLRVYDFHDINGVFNSESERYSSRVRRIDSTVPIGQKDIVKTYGGYVVEFVRKDIVEFLGAGYEAGVKKGKSKTGAPRSSPSATPTQRPTPTQTPMPQPAPTKTPAPSATPTPSSQRNVIEEMRNYVQGLGGRVLINEPIQHQRYSGMAISDVLAIFPDNDDNHIAIEFADKSAGNVSNFFRDGDNEAILDLMNGGVFKSSRGQPAHFAKYSCPSVQYLLDHKSEFEAFKAGVVRNHKPIPQQTNYQTNGRVRVVIYPQYPIVIRTGPPIIMPRGYPCPPRDRRHIRF